VDVDEEVQAEVQGGEAVDLKMLILTLQEERERERGVSSAPQPSSPRTKAHKSKFLKKVSEVYKASDPSKNLGFSPSPPPSPPLLAFNTQSQGAE